MMVTIKNFVLLSGAALALTVSSMAWAGGAVLRINDSRALPVTTTGPLPVTYSSMLISRLGESHYVVDVVLDGFLFCNEFADPGNVENTDIYVRPWHAGWLFGNVDYRDMSAPFTESVPRSFTRVSDWGYTNGVLQLNACDASGATPDCRNGFGDRATLQCFTANASGDAVSETRRLFASGFEAYSTAQNSFVRVMPQGALPVNSDDPYFYTVTYSLPQAVPQGSQQPSDNSPSSVGSSEYILQIGYDSDVFESCDALGGPGSGGMLVSTSGQTLFACYPKYLNVDPNTLNNGKPVVVAVLFTGPNAQHEASFQDNVGFYPSSTQP